MQYVVCGATQKLPQLVAFLGVRCAMPCRCAVVHLSMQDMTMSAGVIQPGVQKQLGEMAEAAVATKA